MAKVHSQQSAVWQAREALPWWFPSQQAMKELIEGAGFNWIKGEGEVQLRQRFVCLESPFLSSSRRSRHEMQPSSTLDVLETVGRQQHDGSFTVNYIRVRFVAQNPQ
ncbi:hypothetical protein HAV15_003466 [Penicillium sp. str. |nr:hypothetical protein HAV15_003466 [Penicillium sp. str. \